MSDFSSLDLDKSIDNSSLTDTLRQPIWIALITSVSIHAILGINLPKLSLFSEQPKLPPTVGLVELTPELIELLPQPEEPEITFSTTVPTSPNFSSETPTPPSELPFVQQPSSELPEIPIDPSDYKLPELPPENSISSSTPTRSTPSVSRLPSNRSSIDNFSYNYPSVPGRTPLPRTPIDTSPLLIIPGSQPPIQDTLESKPEQQLNQEQIDEYQLRKNLGLTDKVYDSGLSRRPSFEIDSRDGSTTLDNSTQSSRSYSQNLQLPPRRYQDKQENQVAVTPGNSNTQTEKTPVAKATSEAPPKPDPTKKNRLPEAPLVRQLREGKTIQDIVEEEKQSEKVAVVTPPAQTSNSNSEVELEETPPPVPASKPSPTPEQPKEHKGSLLENLKKQQQQQQIATATPKPQPSPKQDQKVATATIEDRKPPTPEVKVTPDIAPSPKPSPVVKQQEEFKGSLLQKFQQQKQQNTKVAEESKSRDIALGAVGAYTLWAGELGLAEENLTPPQTISDVYPEAACERKLEGNALVGVLVSPDGVIETGPKLLVDSGYQVLDEAALDAVRNRSFESSDRSKLYQYELSFNSSNCTVAQPTPEANSEETAKPKEEGIPIEVMPPEGE